MTSFKDRNNNEWPVYLDAFLLRDIAKETGIDLADVSAGGWLKLETDSGVVGRVAAVICRDEIKARRMTAADFVKAMRGTAIEAARQAITEEGADFFPPSEWSAIRSNLTKRTEAKEQAESLQAAMAAMEGMSPEFRLGAMQALREAMTEAATEGISSSKLADSAFVAGPEGILLTSATDGPGSAE
jgi:hypothetical protein